jgi:hypothetical protein
MQHRTIKLPLSKDQADLVKRLYLAIPYARLSWGASIGDVGDVRQWFRELLEASGQRWRHEDSSIDPSLP